ncbi:hypothetical protein GCM10010462_14530 [Microbacterium dextranolyticum]|uniref:Uncharacterized protein n=1 Tax=Microbacterium dextranolyticum TaxID=36806 RepID=A0A9W6M5Z7_9MICO|nr:hypothetical protein GCM10017591_11620 [Microbacterium dextranolyticum]
MREARVFHVTTPPYDASRSRASRRETTERVRGCARTRSVDDAASDQYQPDDSEWSHAPHGVP